MSYRVSMGSTQSIILLMPDGLRGFVQSRRAELGLTQKELATAAGVNQPTISDIERGQTKLPAADIRRGLAAGLGVSHLDLLVAAGEITREELGTVAGIVQRSDDDPKEQFVTRLRRVRLTPGAIDSLNWVLGTIEREQGMVKGEGE